MSEIALAVTDIQKTYRRGPESIHAVRGVTFELKRGQVTALVGPSGSGKTTLLNILSGWEHEDSGTVTRLQPELDWSHVGLIPQRLGLLEDLTVRENIELPFLLARRENDDPAARIEEVMTALDIIQLADRLPGETSLGEQQRVCVARALILGPPVVLADEPTGNQDAARQEKVFIQLRAAAADGAACLVATHDPHALRFCDRVLTMHDGELVSDEITDADPWKPRREHVR